MLKSELFMDHKEAYDVLQKMSYPLALYQETREIVSSVMDSENRCVTIPPVQVANRLIDADAHLPMPPAVFEFVEKAYLDAYNVIDSRYAHRLGCLYFYERYGHVNYKIAVAWFRLGAKANVGESDVKLGYCYYYGLGVRRDYEKAYHHLVKATLGIDSSEATYLLGDMYYDGKFVQKDEVMAYELYQRAANECPKMVAGDVFVRLGNYRLYKIGTEDAVREALEDFQIAEYYYLYQMKQQCSGVEKGLAAAQEGQRAAREKLIEMIQSAQREARTRLDCGKGLPAVGGLFWKEIFGE